jgi:hypothetical protein
VQGELRRAFAHWGRPEQLRVDNGCPWGATGGLPTELALWLFGLDVPVIWNQAHRPQQNGVVERTQGVSKKWVESHTCADPEELQQRLEKFDGIQRDMYPSIAGRSRTEAFPELARSGRPYDRAWEETNWNLARALQHAAEYTVVRRVDRNGKVSLYDLGHWLGKQWVGQTVFVSLDPQLQEWVFAAQDGRQLRRRPASELSQENIIGLRVSRPRAPRPPRPTGKKNKHGHC